jgi:ABC-2 type transport system ATP-binding protein
VEEAEALADQVAIIASGKIVAHGPPASLGGRDQGAATIRFRLPAGVMPEDLPVAVTGNGRSVELRTDRELETLFELTKWALDNEVRVTGLTVSRHTLEDVYLQPTGADPDRFQSDSASGAPV